MTVRFCQEAPAEVAEWTTKFFDLEYIHHVATLIKKLFGIDSKIATSNSGYYVVYFGSTETVRWLLGMGLVFNKVKSQVNAPDWILSQKEYMKFFLKGFFDTDGSVYKLRFGIQLSFTNRSIPLLNSLRRCLFVLGFKPSIISCYHIYLTRRDDVSKFFREVGPANKKHRERFRLFHM
ncbi:hypothetical protein HYW55_00340 [Candidatus Gottesmanbacteria bacterium]|nr:hypothetical protein [Candidatus Gottesmanbacteria bacterium]